MPGFGWAFDEAQQLVSSPAINSSQALHRFESPSSLLAAAPAPGLRYRGGSDARAMLRLGRLAGLVGRAVERGACAWEIGAPSQVCNVIIST